MNTLTIQQQHPTTAGYTILQIMPLQRSKSPKGAKKSRACLNQIVSESFQMDFHTNDKTMATKKAITC